MKTLNSKNRPVKIPVSVDLALALIREELKIRKFFNTLREVGIEDCYYQPDLGTLILKSLGLDDGTDETFYRYSDLMDKHCRKITPDHTSIMKEAGRVYRELVKKKSMVHGP